MHSVLPPGPRAAVVKAAEKAGAVFTVQTLVHVVVLLVVGQDVVHVQQGRPGPDVQQTGGLVVLSGTDGRSVTSMLTGVMDNDARSTKPCRLVVLHMLTLLILGVVVV